MPMIGGIENVHGHLLPVMTRTRRKGLIYNTTARASRATSLASIVSPLPIRWDRSTYSTEIPVQIRWKSAGGANKWFSELGSTASNIRARLVSGSSSLVYTSLASNTWSEYENVAHNYANTGTSNVLGYIAGRGLFSYEVLTMPLARP
jgi:hypothetical protein